MGRAWIPEAKVDIRGLHFWSDEEVVTAVEEWANGKDRLFQFWADGT